MSIRGHKFTARAAMRFAVEKTADGLTQLILLNNGRTHSIILSPGELKVLIKTLRCNRKS